MEEKIYIISLSLQACGALVLLMNSIFNTRNQIINSYFEPNNIVDENEENIILENEVKVRNILFGIYLNRISFLCIAFGYAINVLGKLEAINIDGNFLNIIVYSIVLMILCYIVSFILSLIRKGHFCKINGKRLYGRNIIVDVRKGGFTGKNGREGHQIERRIY